MASTGPPIVKKAKLGKPPRRIAVSVSLTKKGRLSSKTVSFRQRRRKRKATFKELFSRILWDDNPLLQEQMEHVSDTDLTEPASLSRPHTAQSSRTYREKVKASEEAWTNVRGSLIKAYLQSLTPPDEGQCCVTGCSGDVQYRCDDCHHQAYFCGPHLVQTHQRKLHVPCSFQDETWTELFVKQEPWTANGGHSCASVQIHNIVVIDSKGRQHGVAVAFCKCESEATQLVKMGLWPASAVKPRVAFSFDLMRWLTMMSLECHVALRNLCQALNWMVPKTLPVLVKNPYSLLSKNSFVEFRFVCNQLESFQFLDNPRLHKPIKPTCLACPDSGGKRVVSLDAMFGLKRWKKSGLSELPPRYADGFFLEQNLVDDFVQSYQHQATSKQSCSSFQAGTLIETKKKSNKIDETGVFGSVCRHEMPISFFSLRQGEQLSNAVYMVQHLLTELPDTEHFILYDIACMLEAHLKKSGQHELLSKVKLAVPAFHIYGHKPSCQIKYSTRRVDGFALSDGEQVERLWSYMRNFVTSTREMTPSHRIDALSDALIHYARKTSRNIGEIILQRYHRATQAVKTAKEELAEAMSSQRQGSEPITETMIRRWITELKCNEVSPSVLTDADITSKEVYAVQLSTYYDMCDEISEHVDTEDHLHTQLFARKLKSIHEQLLQKESGPRWPRDGDELKKFLQINEDRERLAILKELHTLSVDRWFLLHLKKRYADGQKIAKRLLLEVNKVSAAIKKLLHKFCDQSFKTSSNHYPNTLTLDEVFDVKSSIWECLCPHTLVQDNMPRYGKHLLVDALLKVDHSCQEVSMLEAEMKQVAMNISAAITDIQRKILLGAEHPGESVFLNYKLREMKHFSFYIYTLFSHAVELEPVEEPSIVTVIDLQDRELVHEDVDLEVVPTEDDEGTYLDELIDTAETASEHSDSD